MLKCRTEALFALTGERKISHEPTLKKSKRVIPSVQANFYPLINITKTYHLIIVTAVFRSLL